MLSFILGPKRKGGREDKIFLDDKWKERMMMMGCECEQVPNLQRSTRDIERVRDREREKHVPWR